MAFESFLPVLQNEIADKSGLLVAVIHPFYMQFRDNTTSNMEVDDFIQEIEQKETGFEYDLPKGNKRLYLHDQGRSRINSVGYFYRLKKMLQVSRVLLLGEEEGHLKKSSKILRNLGFSGIILSYPTKSLSPNPSGNFTYKEIALRLKQLKCKKLLATGQLNLPSGCVSSFVSHVSEHTDDISYVISPITYPYSSS